MKEFSLKIIIHDDKSKNYSIGVDYDRADPSDLTFIIGALEVVKRNLLEVQSRYQEEEFKQKLREKKSNE